MLSSSSMNLPDTQRLPIFNSSKISPSQEPRPGNSQGLKLNTTLSSYGTSKDLITYLIPDFKAFDYFYKEFVSLDEFNLVEVTEAPGFEIYLVDQWVRDRNIGTIVTVYTGNADSKLKVKKLTIIKKPSKQYPSRFQEYLNELLTNHATFKKMDVSPDNASQSETEITQIPSYVLVTNISAIPHNLNLIAIVGGDAGAIDHRYMINSNLRKLNCGGRSLSLLSEKVSDASEDKFRQMYRILNGSIPIDFAILELVNLVQVCLFYFDLLDAKYADGLLCQKTEDAINSWWNLIGLPHFNSKPDSKSGILSSKTVTGVISLSMSVKTRLQIFGGCDVPKDLFDYENFMISVGQFQKQTKIEKTRKLDLLTLSRLFYFTNQGNSTDKDSFLYSVFGNDVNFDESEYGPSYESGSSLAAPGLKQKGYPNSAANPTASTYRRNKLYYSKELKKLTKAMKNTVQDHIIVKEDEDDIYANSPTNKTSAKLRHKLAFKLTESLAPADMETLDIEIFVKKCISGHTLKRLWLGVSDSSSTQRDTLNDYQRDSKSDPTSATLEGDEVRPYERNKNTLDKHHHHRHHHRHRHRHHSSHNSPYQYKEGLQSDNSKHHRNDYAFVSFRDSIPLTEEKAVYSDRTGRLGRMRFAFQGRRASNKSGLLDPVYPSYRDVLAEDGSPSLLLDTELQKITSHSESTHSDKFPDQIAQKNKGVSVADLLNRRNSFPFIASKNEANLNVIEEIHAIQYQRNPSAFEPSLKKSASCSTLVALSNSTEIISREKMKVDFLEVVADVLRLEKIKGDVSDYECQAVNKSYDRLNLELAKIEGATSSMVATKEKFETEESEVLDRWVKDLTENLDRMAFRSRDLQKRVDEIEVLSSKFESRLQTECLLKMESLTQKLISSAKFSRVFDDEEKRNKVVFALSGQRHVKEEKEESCIYGMLRIAAMFVYELMVSILQLFYFDRSRMNLDRIRSQYKKLDPNRRYINRAYKFIGRDYDLKHEAADDSTKVAHDNTSKRDNL